MNYALLISRDRLFRFQKITDKHEPSEIITLPVAQISFRYGPEPVPVDQFATKTYRLSDSIHTSRGIKYIHHLLEQEGLCESWALATAIEAAATSPGYIHIYQEHL